MEDVRKEILWWEGGDDIVYSFCTQTLFEEKEEQGNLRGSCEVYNGFQRL